MALLNLIAEILSVEKEITNHNNFDIMHAANEDFEVGGSWENYYINAQVKLLNLKQNKDYSLNRLALYEQGSSEVYTRLSPIIVPGSKVHIVLDLEAIAKSRPVTLQDENTPPYPEPDEDGDVVDLFDRTPIYAMQERVEIINNVAGIPFEKNTTTVNLKYTQIMPYSSLHRAVK